MCHFYENLRCPYLLLVFAGACTSNRQSPRSVNRDCLALVLWLLVKAVRNLLTQSRLQLLLGLGAEQPFFGSQNPEGNFCMSLVQPILH